jgi:hypothetical protein
MSTGALGYWCSMGPSKKTRRSMRPSSSGTTSATRTQPVPTEISVERYSHRFRARCNSAMAPSTKASRPLGHCDNRAIPFCAIGAVHRSPHLGATQCSFDKGYSCRIPD